VVSKKVEVPVVEEAAPEAEAVAQTETQAPEASADESKKE
jgi:hypothetical protein